MHAVINTRTSVVWILSGEVAKERDYAEKIKSQKWEEVTEKRFSWQLVLSATLLRSR